MGKIGASLSKSSSRSSSSSGPDRERTEQQRRIWEAAQAAGGQVPSPVQSSLDFLSGVPGAGQQFMNPYQQQVIDRMNEQFAFQDARTTREINDQATRAGAFGGSRQGVAQGVALAENARNQGMQVASLLNQGFEGATGRAQVGANLGMTAGSPDLWRMNVLRQGLEGMPYRTTSKTKGRQIGATVGR